MKFVIQRSLLFLLIRLSVDAQLPSESLLIVNASSAKATSVAMHYAERRGFPQQRILFLSPAEGFYRDAEKNQTRWIASEQDVRTQILEPLRAKLSTLQDPFPTALIFSPDWPTRVNLPGKPPVSLTSFIGFRGVMPESEAIKSGKAISPWYAHPPDVEANKARLWAFPARALTNRGVHPAAMLGVFYPPLDADRLVKSHQRSIEADYSQPSGEMLIVTNGDVRTRARQDQFEPAQKLLEARGVLLQVGNLKTPIPDPLLGL